MIAEGVALISAALPRGEVGPYQLQAAIAAVHDEAATMAETDWPQILGAVRPAGTARAESVHRAQPRGRRGHGARAARRACEVVGRSTADKRMARHHRLLAVRAHLRELAGDTEAAAADYLAAARRTTSLPERRYLALQAARLTHSAQRRSSRR